MKWENIQTQDIKKIAKLRDLQPNEIERNLAIYFVEKNEDLSLNLKEGALCDTFYNVIQFAKNEKLDDDGFVTCFKLILSLLINCKNGLSKEENLLSFKSMIYDLMENGEETQIKKLDNICIKNILDYVLRSFFQHYELYSYLFEEQQEVVQLTEQICLEVVPITQPFPPPLEESMSEELFDRYINPSTMSLQSLDTTEFSVQETSNDDVSVDNSRINVDDVTAEYLMSSIAKDDVKKIVTEAAVKRLADFKNEFEKKISEKESLQLKQVNR